MLEMYIFMHFMHLAAAFIQRVFLSKVMRFVTLCLPLELRSYAFFFNILKSPLSQNRRFLAFSVNLLFLKIQTNVL